ncbi:uncharacterized protein LOC122087621 [Macadamia integrifolia]|uniref:uncharacterized protein LOC122087608 n=1 Tax=Macadamia integrifolia TaxID=60698 RepID=UPI001C4FFCBF|nr:uncharacterized protein LOC122087608 [Macadamia integrifolia]XP_042512751.1 uncharacterized protein LOC122087621 [Macadamia integrifolia]
MPSISRWGRESNTMGGTSSLSHSPHHPHSGIKADEHQYGKSLASWEQKQLHPTQQRTFWCLGLGTFRTLITWFLLIVSMLYILYSSNLLLVNEPRDLNCVSATSVLSTDEHLSSSNQFLHHTNSTSSSTSHLAEEEQSPRQFDTELKHIVFGIAASSNLWEKRKEYIKQWWRPRVTRGVVWMDKPVKTGRNEGLPEIRISGNTSKFPYTNRQGSRSALRISRVVSEMARLKMKDVRWLVMGDDDTVFVVDNVVRVLSKYDHRQFYYVGSSSESHIQNIFFSYAMAYGGGGFAISYPLAKALEKMQDRCIQRYPGLYGSDDRIQACMAELGVPLTRETGFHQYDVYGDLLGLLAAHPITPLVSLHHLDVVDPIFPGKSRPKAIQHLFNSIRLDSASIMQQSICYDKKRDWSISVSWGYVVQILRGVISPRELEMPTRTFLNWYKRADYTAYAFNTRPVTKHPCQKPFIFYMNAIKYDRVKKQTLGIYSRHKAPQPYCRWKMDSPEAIDNIVVIKRPDNQRWQKSPRRDCCRVLSSSKKSTMYLSVGNCQDGETSGL